jgi:hypothetical protein
MKTVFASILLSLAVSAHPAKRQDFALKNGQDAIALK